MTERKRPGRSRRAQADAETVHPLGLGRCGLAVRRDRPGQGPARRRFDQPAGVRRAQGEGARLTARGRPCDGADDSSSAPLRSVEPMAYDERRIAPDVELWRATRGDAATRILPDGVPRRARGRRPAARRRPRHGGAACTAVRRTRSSGSGCTRAVARTWSASRPRSSRDQTLPLERAVGATDARRLLAARASSRATRWGSAALATSEPDPLGSTAARPARRRGVERPAPPTSSATDRGSCTAAPLPLFGYGLQHLGRRARGSTAPWWPPTPAADWADVAARTGYADQAHLCRDFRALAGVTPSGLRANVSDPFKPTRSASPPNVGRMNAASRQPLIELVVADMPATLAFYRRLGCRHPRRGRHRAARRRRPRAAIAPRLRHPRDDPVLRRLRGPRPAAGTGWPWPSRPSRRPRSTRRTPSSRRAGAEGHLEPWDAFWGMRYAGCTTPTATRSTSVRRAAQTPIGCQTVLVSRKVVIRSSAGRGEQVLEARARAPA